MQHCTSWQYRHRALLGAVVSFILLGAMRGFTADTILKFTNECLAPTATITLLVGAGGGFGRVLIDSGVAKVITDMALSVNLSLLLLAWVLAALVRIATGSATVAMTTAATSSRRSLPKRPVFIRNCCVGDRLRRAHSLPCQRRRVLAREGILQHERAADLPHLDGRRNDHLGGRHGAGDGLSYVVG